MNYKKHLCAALLALVPFTAFSQTTVNTPTAPAAAAADKSVPNAPAAIVQDEKQMALFRVSIDISCRASI